VENFVENPELAMRLLAAFAVLRTCVWLAGTAMQ
jgi:hypothetical protein